METKFLNDERGQTGISQIIGAVIVVGVGFIVLSLLLNVTNAFYTSTGQTPDLSNLWALVGSAVLLLVFFVGAFRLTGLI